MDEAIKKFLYPKFILNDNVSDTVREIVKRRAKQNVKLSYFEIEEIVKKAMKHAGLNDTNIVNTADIYNDLAANMRFHIRINDDEDTKTIEEEARDNTYLHNRLS